MHMDFLFRSTFFEMELHRIKVSSLKCTVQRVLTIYTCATVSTLKLYNVTHHPKRNSPAPLQLISTHTWPPSPRQLLVCLPSLRMNFAYSRVHTHGIILWIIFVSDFFPLNIMLLRSFMLLYGWIYKFVYPFSCGGTFGLFPLRTIMSKAVTTIVYNSFLDIDCHFSWVNILEQNICVIW